MSERIPAIDAKQLAAMRRTGEPHGLLDVREADELAIFGRAFFKQALPDADSFTAAFREARTIVGEREESEDHKPSLPQMHGGTAIEAHLARWRAALPATNTSRSDAPASPGD